MECTLLRESLKIEAIKEVGLHILCFISQSRYQVAKSFAKLSSRPSNKHCVVINTLESQTSWNNNQYMDIYGLYFFLVVFATHSSLHIGINQPLLIYPQFFILHKRITLFWFLPLRILPFFVLPISQFGVLPEFASLRLQCFKTPRPKDF